MKIYVQWALENPKDWECIDSSSWDKDSSNDVTTSDILLVLNADSGTVQGIGIGNTALFTGGAGVDTAVGATDTVTLTFDSTELSDLTWGSGSSLTWTMDIGDTDPAIFFDDEVIGMTNTKVGIGTTAPSATTDHFPISAQEKHLRGK